VGGRNRGELGSGAALTIQATLIIPAHNEEARLEATLRHYCAALERRYDQAFEVLVVANGCRDRTANVALRISDTYPQVRVLHIDVPLGKGGAVLAGFAEARGVDLVFADADAATAPESLLQLLTHLQAHEVAIGSRRLPGARITHKQPWRRRLFGWAFALVVRRLFALPYSDTQCGAKALRASAARLLATLVQERSWTFDVDLLLCARAANLSVLECPVTWADQPGSQLRILPAARDVVTALWRLKRRASRLPQRALALPHDEAPAHQSDRDRAVAALP
jgi:glycosyltransferase involved in cell wall biosynthesis